MWNAFVAFWTVSALAGGGILFALFSVPFWFAGSQLLKATVAGSFLRQGRVSLGARGTMCRQEEKLPEHGSWQSGLGRRAGKRIKRKLCLSPSALCPPTLLLQGAAANRPQLLALPAAAGVGQAGGRRGLGRRGRPRQEGGQLGWEGVPCGSRLGLASVVWHACWGAEGGLGKKEVSWAEGRAS